jgi:hypothetical protein
MMLQGSSALLDSVPPDGLRFAKDIGRLRRQRYVAPAGAGFYEIEAYGARWFARYCRCSTRRIGPSDGFATLGEAIRAAADDADAAQRAPALGRDDGARGCEGARARAEGMAALSPIAMPAAAHARLSP